MAVRRKHTRLKRVLTTLTAVGIAGALSLGPASMATANDEPAGDEAVAQIETAPTEEVTAQPAVDQPTSVEEVKVEAPAEPAPVTSGPSSVSAPEVAPAPAEPVAEEVTVESNETTVEVATKTPTKPKKVFVCKYVGTPGSDERLQTGNNPISVSVHAIQNNQWNGTVPGWFSDAHDRSYVLAYDTGQPKPNVSDCPSPEGPPEPRVVTGHVVFASATCPERMNTITADPVEGHGWLLTDKRGGTYRSGINQGVTTGTIRNGGVPGGMPFGETVITLEDLDLTDNITAAPLREVWTTVDPATLECENPNPEPVVVTGSAVFTTLSCTAGTKNSIDTDKVPGGVWTLTDKNGKAYTSDYGTEIDETSVPGELAYGDITVTLADGDDNDNYTVTPWEGVWTTVDPATLECGGPGPDPEPVVVTGTATFQTLSCTEGSKNWADAKAVPGGVWTFTDANNKTFITNTGAGYNGGVPDGLSYGKITVSLSDVDTLSRKADNYTVTPWEGVWTTVDPATLKCGSSPTPTTNPEPTHTAQPSPTPVQMIVPVTTPTPKPTTKPTVKSQISLAATGPNEVQTQNLGALAALTVLGGAALVGLAQIARRRRG